VRLIMKMADSEGNHNGGLLLFGPDGLLYVGTGDGGGAGDRHGPRGNAQNLGSPLGKILRLDVRDPGPYRIPAANPFAGRPGARGEVYAYGLRNPWRFSFDRANGDLAIGDVGQNAIEEIDFVRFGDGRGANFGWRVFEGRRRYTEGERAPGAIPPVIETKHSDGNCSITGGVVVRDRALAGLYGRYVFGDFCKGLILSAHLKRPRATSLRSTGLRVKSLSSFGEDASGRVYAVSLDGPVYRLTPK
jgi:glucose/arabinose dehydrogenase